MEECLGAQLTDGHSTGVWNSPSFQSQHKQETQQHQIQMNFPGMSGESLFSSTPTSAPFTLLCSLFFQPFARLIKSK